VRKATVYDVAELAGVSIATVSFAFTRPEKIKPGTVESVMAAADKLGYVPSASARGPMTTSWNPGSREPERATVYRTADSSRSTPTRCSVVFSSRRGGAGTR
jgi:hypothetical protein